MVCLSGMVYKSWCLNALELSFILNLGILAPATYHVNQSRGSQGTVAYTSVGIAFFTFVIVSQLVPVMIKLTTHVHALLCIIHTTHKYHMHVNTHTITATK